MKKLRNIIIGFISLVLFVLTACIDDRGNYDYMPVDEVVPAKISGLEENYDFLFGSTYQLNATVEGLEDENKYQFMWYIYKYPNNSERDTLGYGKELDLHVTQETGNYFLYFEVRDKQTDVFVNWKMDVSITTELSQGWFIVKDKNGETDVDFVNKDNCLMSDILKTNINTTLSGEGVSIFYHSKHSHDVENEDGTVTKLTNQKVFYILSTNDMKVVNAENLQLYKNYEDCFYEAPAVRSPEYIMGGTSQVNLINNGKVHMYGAMSTNSGKFSYSKVGMYDLAPYCVDISSNRYVVFDKVTRSLCTVDNNESGLVQFSAPAPGTPDFGNTENMDADLKTLLFWKKEYIPNPYAFYYYLYALMKDDSGKNYIATLKCDKTTYPLTGYDEIPAGCLIGDGEAFVCHASSPCIYFGIDNVLYMHEVGPSKDPAVREHKLHTFSSDETIAMMRLSSAGATGNHLVVLTNSSSGWKLYVFPMIAGSADVDFSNLVPLASGEGTGRYCTYLKNGYES